MALRLTEAQEKTISREPLTTLVDIYIAYVDNEHPLIEEATIKDLLVSNDNAIEEGITMFFNSEQQLLRDRLFELQSESPNGGEIVALTNGTLGVGKVEGEMFGPFDTLAEAANFGATSNKRAEFERVTEEVMKFLVENYHPHAKIIITSDSAEIVEGTQMHITNKYIL